MKRQQLAPEIAEMYETPLTLEQFECWQSPQSAEIWIARTRRGAPSLSRASRVGGHRGGDHLPGRGHSQVTLRGRAFAVAVAPLAFPDDRADDTAH
jgi:hypothetical protein